MGWAGAAASPLRAMAEGRLVESFPRTSAQVCLPEIGFLRPDKGLLCCPPSSLSGLQAALSSRSHSRIHSAAPLREAGPPGGSAQPSRVTPGPAPHPGERPPTRQPDMSALSSAPAARLCCSLAHGVFICAKARREAGHPQALTPAAQCVPRGCGTVVLTFPAPLPPCSRRRAHVGGWAQQAPLAAPGRPRGEAGAAGCLLLPHPPPVCSHLHWLPGLLPPNPGPERLVCTGRSSGSSRVHS